MEKELHGAIAKLAAAIKNEGQYGVRHALTKYTEALLEEPKPYEINQDATKAAKKLNR